MTSPSSSARGQAAEGSPDPLDPYKRPALIGLLAVVLLASLIAIVVALWPDSSSDSSTSSLPTVPDVASDSCTSAGFQSLLLGSITDDIAPSGDPRCLTGYGVLPLVRTAANGNESLVAVFKVGADGSWEHFATVKVDDCITLPEIESEFPVSLCDQ